MKFELDSSQITFNGKNFLSFFESINATCQHFEINYFIVGAFARDIILKNIFNQPTGIATKDIDIAIRINSWDKYDEFIDYLNEVFLYLLNKEDNSLFVTQLTNSSTKSYSFWLRVMKALAEDFKNQ